jgi:hypothetical protein
MKRKNTHLKIIMIVFTISLNSLYAQDTFPGTALYFDGLFNYVECGNSNHIGITNAMTIEAWVKVPSSVPDGSHVGVIIGNYDHYPNFNFEGYTGGGLRLWWNDGEVNVNTTNIDLRDDSWHHVAVTRDSVANQIIFYADGQKITSVNQTGSNADYHWPLRIGRDFASNPVFPFNGIIDEVRLWNVARSTQEIRENMHLTLNGSETGLLACWQFNEASGNITSDPVGGHDGTLYNFDADEWVESNVPVGGGTSITRTVSSSGIYDFIDTGMYMNFTAKTGTDTIVVTRLDRIPDTTIVSCPTYGSQYWLINKFGSGTFTVNLIFISAERILHMDEQVPDAFRLFNRPGNSEGSWSNIMGASAASVSDLTITFEGISSFGRFFIGKELFSNINTGLDGLSLGSVVWGDYDNDGDLDIIQSGLGESALLCKIYRNDTGVFTDINAGLAGTGYGSLALGDYDNDGDLDILMTGMSFLNIANTIIYRNDSGVFTDINAGLDSVYYSSGTWGDYDNDGDLDVLISGREVSDSSIARIYRNDISVSSPGGQAERIFTDINAGLTGVYYGSGTWGDYDNDGDLDILITGINSADSSISKIYRNDLDPSQSSGHAFTDINADLTGVCAGSAAWGDYDNDGDPDILLTGYVMTSTLSVVSEIYRNDDGVFTSLNAGLPGVIMGSAIWGDYDNDGDLDFLLTGETINSDYISRIYCNDLDSLQGSGHKFTDIDAGLINDFYNSTAWGDYDNDGNLDILLMGSDDSNNDIFRIYHNNNRIHNTIPFSPDGLTADIYADSISFSWNKANDNETPQDGLSYNLVIGFSELDSLLVSSMADMITGYRLISAIGNTGQLTAWTYQIQIPGLYQYTQVITPDYWGVQTIDHAFAASPFAMQSLIPITYIQIYNDEILNLADLLAWNIVHPEAVFNYQIQIDDEPAFTHCEINDTLEFPIVPPPDDNKYSVELDDLIGCSNLVVGTKYYWRMKPNYSFGYATAFTKPAGQFWFGFKTAIDDQETTVPKDFALLQNYPNPFNPLTQIKYALPQNARIKIELYDMLGRKIQTLLDEQKNAGYHSIKFNASRYRGMASGVYVYKIVTDKGFSDSKKMILLR